VAYRFVIISLQNIKLGITRFFHLVVACSQFINLEIFRPVLAQILTCQCATHSTYTWYM